MRRGKITRTVWNRTIKRELNKDRRKNADILSPFGGVSGLEEDGFCWTDACVTGTSCRTGYYAVLQAAGSLAEAGVRPASVSVRVLLPEETQEEQLEGIAAAVEEACRCMDISVTEFQGDVTSSVLCITVFAVAAGRAEKISGSAKHGENSKSSSREILLCGYTGLEGTLHILDEGKEELEKRFVPDFLMKAENLKNELVLPHQILSIFERKVTAVRQIGSGGILGALWELAEMNKTGFEIDMSRMALKQETVEICEYYRLNPYQMTSAGSYLILTDEAEPVLEILEKVGARAGRLGVARDQNARVITSGEEIRYLDRPAPDQFVCWLDNKLIKDSRVQE